MKDHSLYFSFEHFAHASLWQEGDPIWSALWHLDAYLQSFASYRIEIEVKAGVFLEKKEQIFIGEGSTIEPGAYIEGPCILGKGCKVRHGAYLRGGVVLGDECLVGHGTEIKHSILLNGASAAHFSYVGDSILGADVNLGAGVKCANLRLDRAEVMIREEKKTWATKLYKLGAVIGDRSQIGCNSVLNPGTVIGKESLCFPLQSVRGVIAPRSQIDEKGVHPIAANLLEKLLCQSMLFTAK